MAKAKSEKAPEMRKKWDKVFNALVKLCKNLQKDRQFLEDNIKSLQELMHKMKMEQKIESWKSELMLSLKERNTFIYKRRCENANDELADFQEWFDYLYQKCSEPNDTSGGTNKRDSTQNNTLKDEVRKLKSEIEKCKLDKNTEISALLSEKNFVWNQYKNLESDFTKRLQEKYDEAENANEKVLLLVKETEQLQLSNERLRIDFAKVESESAQKSEEISRLLKEIELLKSKTTPTLRRCRAAVPDRGGKNSATGGRVQTVKKESDPSLSSWKARLRRSAHMSTTGRAAPVKQLAGEESSHSKRKADDVITIEDTPKLFTSSFKVPKLKSLSSPQIS